MKITICGSMAFYSDMEDIKKKLEAKGHEVLIPLLDNELPAELGGGRTLAFNDYIEKNGGIDNFAPNHKLWNFKEGAINDHFSKVAWSDAILVVNNEKRGIEGYVGGNTLVEIGLAFYLKKKIYLLNEVSSKLSYKVEVFGMKPILLGGNIANIK